MRLRIVQCSQEHLDKCAEHKLLGSNTEPFTDWRSGDYIAFDVDGSIAGLAKVRGLPYEEKRRIWPDDVYPYRIPVEFEFLLPRTQRLDISITLRHLLAEAWGAQNDASFEQDMRSRRAIAEPHAERILGALRRAHTSPEEETAVPDVKEPQPAVAPAAEPAALVLRNCRQGAACGQGWDDLVKTELPMVRFCTRCERAVYRCDSGEELMASLAKDRCVAIVAGR